MNKVTQQSTTDYALLLYMTFIILQITLIPFNFHVPMQIKFTWDFYYSGIITNVFLFVPIGFLYCLAQNNSDRLRWNQNGFNKLQRFIHLLCIKELLLGLLLSLIIEIVQGFIPGRISSGYDIITNGAGAWVGAQIFEQIGKRINKGQMAGLFALKLPLMNLVYLLIPLLWLNGLSAGKNPIHLALLALLGLFGSMLMFSIYYHNFHRTKKISVNLFTLSVLVWFFVSSVPALLRFPLPVITLGLSIGIFIRLRFFFPLRLTPDTRRYELPALQRLLPIYLFYMLALFLWPTTMDLHMLQETYLFEDKGRVFLIFGFLERFAAYTLLGYIVAEMRGRKNENLGRTLVWILFISLNLLVVNGILRGVLAIHFSLFLELFIVVSASIYGGIIYRLQLRAFRDLLRTP